MNEKAKPPTPEFRKKAEHVTLQQLRAKAEHLQRRHDEVKRSVDRSASPNLEGPPPPNNLPRTPPTARAQLAELGKKLEEAKVRREREVASQREHLRINQRDPKRQFDRAGRST